MVIDIPPFGGTPSFSSSIFGIVGASVLERTLFVTVRDDDGFLHRLEGMKLSADSEKTARSKDSLIYNMFVNEKNILTG